MAITGMYKDSVTGQLRIVLEDRTVAFTGQDGNAFGPNNIIERTVSDHGSDDAMHIYTKTTHMVSQLVHASSISKDPKRVESLQIVVAAYRDRLLEMLDCLLYIHSETERCDKAFTVKDGRVTLPQIKSLQEKVETFLLNAKRALTEIAKILNIFFEDSKPGHDYDKHAKWALERFGPDGGLSKILKDNTSNDRWIEQLVGLRNRVEHPKDGYRLVVKNIEYHKNSMKMLPATWSSDMQSWDSDLRIDMEIYINNLLVLSEDLIAASIIETQALPNITVVSIPKEQRNPERPVRFALSVSGLPSPNAAPNSDNHR